MILEIVWSCVAGVIIGIVIDGFLFNMWHKHAHSNKLRLEEKKQKEIEFDNNISIETIQ